MSNCIFCGIATGKLPADIICENDELVCFLPLGIEVQGHTLIVPKVHYVTVEDAPAELGQSVFAMAQKLAGGYRKALGMSGFNLLNANGADAEQSVPHLHFHFLPRFAGDGVNAWPALPGFNGDRAALKQLLAREL